MEIKTFNEWLEEVKQSDTRAYYQLAGNKATTSTQPPSIEVVRKNKTIFEIIDNTIASFKFKVLQTINFGNNLKLGELLLASKTVYAEGSDKPIKNITDLKKDKIFIIK